MILLGAVLLDRAREYFTVKNSIVSWVIYLKKIGLDLA
jgi:hypothetical protein